LRAIKLPGLQKKETKTDRFDFGFFWWSVFIQSRIVKVGYFISLTIQDNAQDNMQDIDMLIRVGYNEN